MTWRSSIGPLLGTLVAVSIAFFHFQVSRSIPVIHDAAGYHRIAHEIWTDGLFAKWQLSDLRTWGYPTFLGGVLTVAETAHISERWAIFVVQLALHLASVFALRMALRRARIEPWVTDSVFYVLLAHPFVLIYPAYMLTESLSLSLGTAVLACTIAMVSSSRKQIPLACAGGVLCGAMIAVRPASLFMVPVFLLALVAVWLHRRPTAPKMVAIATVGLLGLLLPLMPQLRNNIVHYGRPSVLLARPVGSGQQSIGILWIKYATSIHPNMDPQIKYLNPLAVDEALAFESPAAWYLHHPARGLVTFALHAFDLLDQDLPLPYNLTLVPAYYPYVSIANLFVVALGLSGIGLVAPGWRRRTAIERWTIAFAVMTLVCSVGLYSTGSVEARYGMSALIVLYAFAAICAGWLIRTARNRSRLLVGGFVVAFCIGGSLLSAWVRWQAPPIRAELLAEPAGGRR